MPDWDQSGATVLSQEPDQPIEGQQPHNTGIEGTVTASPATTGPDSDNSSLPCRICTVVFFLWFALAACSLAIGLWRAFATADEGKGFTDAAYVVAVGGLIIYPIQTRHDRNCKRAVGD